MSVKPRRFRSFALRTEVLAEGSSPAANMEFFHRRQRGAHHAWVLAGRHECGRHECVALPPDVIRDLDNEDVGCPINVLLWCSLVERSTLDAAGPHPAAHGLLQDRTGGPAIKTATSSTGAAAATPRCDRLKSNLVSWLGQSTVAFETLVFHANARALSLQRVRHETRSCLIVYAQARHRGLPRVA